MAEKKMTRKEALEMAIEIFEQRESSMFDNELQDAAVEVLTKMVTQIEKQAKRPRSKSSARVANEPIAREFVKKLVTVGEPVNAKWMTYNVRFCTTPQKAVAVAKIAEEWGAIERISIKNRTFYSLVEGFEVPAEW